MTYYGAKKVIAWHLSELGVGGVFTVEQLEHWVQAAMIEQGRGGKRVEVDRRLRELRDLGWVISSFGDDARLARNEYRLIQVGQRIWEAA